MSKDIKGFAVAVLIPIARLRRRLIDPIVRLWSHARLAERITSPLDPSVVVLGVPEIHGTGNIRLGRRLYLYPGLYLARIFHKKGRLSFNPLIKWLFRQERFGRS
ncbi:hypothetical protein [Thiocapsa bogorovii]|uniref:hypothetical protein n=1 Tax=Thiocapsa bogorovii TaxID=521689 RepID=UPI001E5AA04E|nr:hypothetical protein [Thiocapsa bogorovii]UHD18703.1 hypothetical protein LT988_11995 [Thiocapsa bogorovii]